MDGDVGPTPPSATVTSTVRPTAVSGLLSPPLHEFPVESPETDLGLPDVIDVLSEDDHDRDHGLDAEEIEEDQDHVQNQFCATGESPEDLKQKIIKQVEYYFSDENLPTDKYLLSLIKKNKEGFEVRIWTFNRTGNMNFNFESALTNITLANLFGRMKKLTRDTSFIVAALKESSLLIVSCNGKKVKRLYPFILPEARDPKSCTVLVDNLPEDRSVENIRRIFGDVGSIRNITVRDPHTVDKSVKGNKELLISSKLHALVEYETVEAAEKAVATLNNEHDWRNGLHVKLLKHSGQRRHAWRGSDSEKGSTSRTSDHARDEDLHNLSDHHDDTVDEVEGDHLLKEKNGQKGRNQGRSARHKYQGTNGMGHGTASSGHVVETSKPPPGPRMPDGTRGFTMGRGRRAVSNQS